MLATQNLKFKNNPRNTVKELNTVIAHLEEQDNEPRQAKTGSRKTWNFMTAGWEQNGRPNYKSLKSKLLTVVIQQKKNGL